MNWRRKRRFYYCADSAFMLAYYRISSLYLVYSQYVPKMEWNQRKREKPRDSQRNPEKTWYI